MDGKEETSLQKVFKILYVGPERNCQVGKDTWRENQAYGFWHYYLKCCRAIKDRKSDKELSNKYGQIPIHW